MPSITPDILPPELTPGLTVQELGDELGQLILDGYGELPLVIEANGADHCLTLPLRVEASAVRLSLGEKVG